MNALKYGFGLILVGGFALTASCGGSSDDSSSSGGTSSSKGGTSSSTGGTIGNTTGGTIGNTTGGTIGNTTGGTGNPSGGTGNPNGGTGNPNGGTGNPAGGNGAGGATMNPASCPPATPTPMTGDVCTVATTMPGMPRPACVYGNTSCTCRPMRGGGGQAGAPATGDGTLRCGPLPAMCPAASSTPPVDGSACTGLVINCQFDSGERCSCFNMQWNCQGGMGAAGAGG